MKLALKNGEEDEYYAYIETLNKATANIKRESSDLGLNENSRMQMSIVMTEAQKNELKIDTFGSTRWR